MMKHYESISEGESDHVVNEATSLLPKPGRPSPIRSSTWCQNRALIFVLLLPWLAILSWRGSLDLRVDSGFDNNYLPVAMFFRRRSDRSVKTSIPNISVAFIGNSMTFYNDLPRFIQALSDYHLLQNSCLHPSVSLTSILATGSGMFDKFNTLNARNEDGIYDYGACTVQQLLLGYDYGLEQQVFRGVQGSYVDDGTNPCLRDPTYLTYLNTRVFANHTQPHWDFVVINDNTRGPGRPWNREAGLNSLQDVYIPWFLETGATPIFFDTHGYLTADRDLKNIPTFTSLTYFGYEKYSSLMAEFLPDSQTPRIALVGIAFLTVWEENRSLWYSLFHSFDLMHASTSGTFLTGCVIFYAIYGRMPDKQIVFQNQDVSHLWAKARILHEQPPSIIEAYYLYHVAERVMRLGHRPKSLKLY